MFTVYACRGRNTWAGQFVSRASRDLMPSFRLSEFVPTLTVSLEPPQHLEEYVFKPHSPSDTHTMSSLRFARAALRARPAAIRIPAGRRTYADAVPDKIKLSLAMPHQVR